MREIIDLDRYPLDRPESAGWQALVDRCKDELARNGLFNLVGFMRPEALKSTLGQMKPVLAEQAFTHARKHNIYFKKDLPGLAADHPALKTFETINHTICADQMGDALIIRLYDWEPFAGFLAEVMDKPMLYPMADPLARANVMEYRDGEALNWHFDRSEFTTTLLLQAPDAGGEFQYLQDLRSDADPNYDGVAHLLNGNEDEVTQIPLQAGTLNVFRGKNTAHRVTPVAGDAERIIAVFSYYEQPGVVFSETDRVGFYGRAG
ncbi:MAG: 2OG-Fe(II) oxygenase [Rhodobacteraceae bacterium]|nr:2OG-Fe(II) oxygenase [Paracoccaceae bacterium]